MNQTESAEFARLHGETVRFSETTQRAFLAALHHAVISNGGTWPARDEDVWKVIKLFDDARAGQVETLMRNAIDAANTRPGPVWVGIDICG